MTEHGNTGRVGHEIAQRHVGPPEVGGRANGAVPVHEAGVPIPMPSTGYGERAIVARTSSTTTAGSTPRPCAASTAAGRLAHEHLTGDVEHRRPEPGRDGQVDGQREQPRLVEVDEGPLARAGLDVWVRRREPDPSR